MYTNIASICNSVWLFQIFSQALVTKPVRIYSFGSSHHLNRCSAFVPVILCFVYQPIFQIFNKVKKGLGAVVKNRCCDT